jgi:type IV secretion system protein VirB11
VIHGERTLRYLLAGDIQPFLDDHRTTEVVVNRPGEIGVEQDGRWSWFDRPGLTFDKLDAIGILAAAMTSREVDSVQPLCTSTLPGGERIQICRPPATLPDRISLTIRKPATFARTADDPDFVPLFSAANSTITRSRQTDRELIGLKRAGDWRAFWGLARKTRKTIGITGITGSGKTDVAKRLIQLTGSETRIVTIEDNPETKGLGPRNTVNLFYGDSRAKLTAEMAVQAALRMRPDEIHLAEVRGAEAFAFLRAVAAGHPGSITTWHAGEGMEISALVAMVKQHEAGRALDDVEERIRTLVDIIVWCTRGEDGFSAPRVWMRAEEDLQHAA